MTHILWSQDFFAKGELSPLMYSRVTLQAYYQGLKRAKNVLCFPQGAAGKRFGTRFSNEIVGENNYKLVYFKSFQYLNECCYLVVIRDDKIDIYLEDFKVAEVSATGIRGSEIELIDHTVLENRFRITTGIYRPKDLIRVDDTPDPITSFSADTLSVASTKSIGSYYPARFTTTGTMPQTSPQIHANRTYFIRFVTANAFRIYQSAIDAAKDINEFSVTSAGTTASLVIRNSWSLSNSPLRNLPVFDFTGGYDASEFTPGAQTGYSVTITRTTGSFNFESRYIGGVFAGNGGIARIISTNGTDEATVNIIIPFDSTAAIPGSLVLIAEPAWSDTRGWPRKCSSFQNRAFFANTDTLTNGLWGSVINDFEDFDETEGLDDSAISWFPTSDTVNYIQRIVPYRSLTIHTNSGVYSTPLSVETVITPNNFSLALQDSTPADNVRPQGIDNQIVVLSGNDAYSLLWDGFNNAYTSNIISIANEHLIRDPIDEAPYVDKQRAGSRYMFIVNGDGTLAIYQSLIAENVSGFTPASFEQSYGKAYFRGVTSNFDGRAWFLVERELAKDDGLYSIDPAIVDDYFFSSYDFNEDTPTAILFTAASLPSTSPEINSNTYYWAVGDSGLGFRVYLTQDDALNGVNHLELLDVGTDAFVNPFPLGSKLLIEELDFDAEVDCAGFYPTPDEAGPTTGITTNERFNAQEVFMQGDGFGFNTTGINDTIEFNAHGVSTYVERAQYGFPISVEITPLAISSSLTGNPKNSNLVEPKHVRFATLVFADTRGGYIEQGTKEIPIALNKLENVKPGFPPLQKTGKFEISVFGGWDDFTNDIFKIKHKEPFGIKLIGIFYRLEA